MRLIKRGRPYPSSCLYSSRRQNFRNHPFFSHRPQRSQIRSKPKFSIKRFGKNGVMIIPFLLNIVEVMLLLLQLKLIFRTALKRRHVVFPKTSNFVTQCASIRITWSNIEIKMQPSTTGKQDWEIRTDAYTGR